MSGLIVYLSRPCVHGMWGERDSCRITGYAPNDHLGMSGVEAQPDEGVVSFSRRFVNSDGGRRLAYFLPIAPARVDRCAGRGNGGNDGRYFNDHLWSPLVDFWLTFSRFDHIRPRLLAQYRQCSMQHSVIQLRRLVLAPVFLIAQPTKYLHHRFLAWGFKRAQGQIPRPRQQLFGFAHSLSFSSSSGFPSAGCCLSASAFSISGNS